MRRTLVSGNWKMHHTHLEAIAVVQKLGYALERSGIRSGAGLEVTLHPPFTALRSVQTVVSSDSLPIGLGAQDVHWEDKGAYTGEVSPVMLAKLDVAYVIVGHSERRQHFGETDGDVARKASAVLGAGMTPIICVGEDADQRAAGETEAHVVGQLRAALAGLAPEAVGTVVVAYEPLWAIGAGASATPDDAQAVAAELRASIVADHGAAAGETVRIQYGGSVNEGNVAALLSGPDLDGALVGGASLQADSFAGIVAALR